jgi:HlyD family secretion protein
MKRSIVIIAAVVTLAAIAGCKLFGNGNTKIYKTAKADKTDLVVQVKATGTVQPIKLVQVGSQVTGKIMKLYVDYNSPVTEGQIIAQIDDTTFKAKVAQDDANLKKAMADVEQGRAKLNLASKELVRDRELASREVISKSALDTSLTNRAALAAQVKTLEAVVEQTRAILDMDRINLGYTTIRSPVNGVVVARNVDEGQTVIASLSVQTIYNIATDLTKIQVQGSIPEADIGRIAMGQPVLFTVDAFPDLKFEGHVSEVRLAAVTISNVVTYPVIVLADNPELKLKPSMTANIYIEVARHPQALVVPNAALRYKPEFASANKSASSPSPGSDADKEKDKDKNARQIWVKTGDSIAPVGITTGLSDGTNTEVLTGELQPGQEVVIGEETAKSGAAPTNPFMPKFSKSGKRSLKM